MNTPPLPRKWKPWERASGSTRIRSKLAVALAAAAIFLALGSPAWGADFPGRYFGAEGSSVVLDVAPRRSGAFGFAWRSDPGKRLRGLGLSDGADLLAASINTGGAAYGLSIFTKGSGAWRGRWITSIDGGGYIGEMTIEGDSLPGRKRFSGRSRAGAFEGSVGIAARGGAFLLNFTSAGGAALYRGLGAITGDRLVVAWSFGGNPTLALYVADSRGLSGRRFSLARGQKDALIAPERFTRDGLDDTIFPPLLPGSSAAPNP